MIGRLWIQDFDEKTRAKANGRARLLLVDGHNSHYTKEFLEFTKALMLRSSEHSKIACNSYPRKHSLSIQGHRSMAIQPRSGYSGNDGSQLGNIITESVTVAAGQSCSCNQFGPSSPAPSSAHIGDAQHAGSSTSTNAPAPTGPVPQWQTAAKDAFNALGRSTSSLCPLADFSNAQQTALLEGEAREAQSKAVIMGMQSSIVLQGMFCERLSSQLAGQEEKQRKRKKGQLNGDGLPRLLTGDDFYNRVAEHERTSAIEEAARQARKRQRNERAGLMDPWKQAEKERLERNKARRTAFHEELALWTEECARAKEEGRRPGWVKPKLGKLEKPIPKPGADVHDGDDSEDEGQDDENENDNDNDNED